MTQRTRDFLKPEFKDGERPSGADFADLIDSFLNISSDGVSLDTDGNLVLSRGVRLGDSNDTVAGGLRFSGGQVQYFDGTNWVGLSGGAAQAFSQLGATTSVAYTNNGNVGIGAAFSAAAPPACRLDVSLAAGSATERARFGNAVCLNGTAIPTSAVFAHTTFANDSGFAFRQLASGETSINSGPNQPITFLQGGNTTLMGLSKTGNVIIGDNADLTTTVSAQLQVGTGIWVKGAAVRSNAATAWDTTSDARTKEDVRDLQEGLAELQKIRPIRFQYNGTGGTPKGQEGVGVLAQEIETVLPETVRKVETKGPPETRIDDLRIFNPSALTFVLINAVKELAERVEALESALADGNPKKASRTAAARQPK
jgi:hypothetical protein